MTSFVDQLLHIPAPLAYTLIGALVFCEAAVFVGFVIPGETAVLLGGVMASSGRLSLSAVLVLVVVAAVVGDSVGYEVGRHLGPRVLELRPVRRHKNSLDGAQTMLRHRGGWAVFIARFTAFLRAVMPGLAGLSRMAYPRFLAYNAAGGLVWGVGVTLLGFFAGNSYARIEKDLGRGSAVLLLVLVVGGLLIWHRRRRHRLR